LLFFLAIWVALAWQVNPSEFIKPAQDNAAVMAATYGIAAAVSLFIPLARPPLVTGATTIVDPAHQLVDSIARWVGAAATVIAGWFWLDSTIKGPIGPWLVPMVAAFAIITLSVVSAPLISSLREWNRTRRENRAEQKRRAKRECQESKERTAPVMAPMVGVLAIVAIAIAVLAWKLTRRDRQRN